MQWTDIFWIMNYRGPDDIVGKVCKLSMFLGMAWEREKTIEQVMASNTIRPHVCPPTHKAHISSTNANALHPFGQFGDRVSCFVSFPKQTLFRVECLTTLCRVEKFKIPPATRKRKQKEFTFNQSRCGVV